MHTQIELERLANRLQARLTINDNAISIYMPLTRSQARQARPHGDLLCFDKSETLQVQIDKTYQWMLDWEEFWSLKNDVKKKEIEAFVKNKLHTDDRWTVKALNLIMSHQLIDEQNAERTVYHNCVGFTGHDAPLLTSFAKQVETRNFLTPKQMAILKKTMPKYWRQIVDASDELKLLRQVKKARPAPQAVQTTLAWREYEYRNDGNCAD